MKRKAITIMMMFFLASTVMALFPLSVKAKATKTYLTGTETSGPILDPGIMWISEEGIIHIRGFVHVWYDVCTDPRCTGMNTVVANVNLDPTTGTGLMWGTYSTEVDGVVTWEGTWTGTMHADDSESIRAVGHGRGPLEGLKVQITIEFPPDPTAPGIISGYILDPHGE